MALIECNECKSRVSDRATSCPKCGAPISPVATAAAVAGQLKVRPAFKVIGGVIVVLIGAGVIFNLLQGRNPLGTARFDDATIESIKQDIRAKFAERKGVSVEEVEMIAESPKTLTGFVKFKAPFVGELTKECTATMGDEGKTIWKCE